MKRRLHLRETHYKVSGSILIKIYEHTQDLLSYKKAKMLKCVKSEKMSSLICFKEIIH